MAKHIYRLNRPIFEKPIDHPARRFLVAFLDCLSSCVGQELPLPFGRDIDQEWWSEEESRKYLFSDFAYGYLSFTIELDGWLTSAPKRTESETAMLNGLPKMRRLMTECKAAALNDNNTAVIEMIETVMGALDLWQECIEIRTKHDRCDWNPTENQAT